MIDNTYDRFVIRRAEGRSMTIVNSDNETVDCDNLLFGTINSAPRCGIDIHVTTTKKRRSKKYGTETQYLIQGEYKVFRKKTTHVCSDCVDT